MTERLPHVRCYCGKVIGNKWSAYEDMLSQGVPIREALNELGLTRYCCRMRMMSPFTVVTNVDRQEIEGEGTEKLKDKLTVINTGVANPVAPLNAIAPRTTSIPSSSYGLTIEPEEPIAGIELPPIPVVSIAPVAPGGKIESEQEIKITRRYEAR